MFAACMLRTMRACVLGVEFTKGTQTPGATTGVLALHINDQQAGTLEDAMIQIGKFALCGEGLNIGRDGGVPSPTTTPADGPGRSAEPRSAAWSSTSPASPTSTSRWKPSQ